MIRMQYSSDQSHVKRSGNRNLGENTSQDAWALFLSAPSATLSCTKQAHKQNDMTLKRAIEHLEGVSQPVRQDRNRASAAEGESGPAILPDAFSCLQKQTAWQSEKGYPRQQAINAIFHKQKSSQSTSLSSTMYRIQMNP